MSNKTTKNIKKKHTRGPSDVIIAWALAVVGSLLNTHHPPCEQRLATVVVGAGTRKEKKRLISWKNKRKEHEKNYLGPKRHPSSFGPDMAVAVVAVDGVEKVVVVRWEGEGTTFVVDVDVTSHAMLMFNTMWLVAWGQVGMTWCLYNA
jgi:hypothetical protein